MKKLSIVICFLGCSTMYAVTNLYNATTYPLRLKVTYATQCVTNGDVSLISDQNTSQYETNLPVNAKIDVSGTGSQIKRIKPWCYKDIASIKATITVHDDDKNTDTEIARTWYSDQISQRQNWVIRYSPQQLLTLQPQQ